MCVNAFRIMLHGKLWNVVRHRSSTSFKHLILVSSTSLSHSILDSRFVAVFTANHARQLRVFVACRRCPLLNPSRQIPQCFLGVVTNMWFRSHPAFARRMVTAHRLHVDVGVLGHCVYVTNGASTTAWTKNLSTASHLAILN